MFEPLHISTSDSVAVHETVQVAVVGGSATTGVAFSYSTFQAPEQHIHPQPPREPLATVDALTFTFVAAGCATLPRIRQLFWRDYYSGP